MSNTVLFRFFLLAVAGYLPAGCGPDYIFQQKSEVPGETWTYEDSIRYDVMIRDTSAVYNLFLDVKHSVDFSFQNLYIRIHTRFPDGKRLSKPVSFELADKAGIWQGNCGSQYCTLRIPIQEGAYFDAPGTYVFVLEQYMRQNPIPGIASIGLHIQKTGEKR